MNLDDKKKEKTVEMKAVDAKPSVEEKEEIVEDYNPTGEVKTVKCPELVSLDFFLYVHSRF